MIALDHHSIIVLTAHATDVLCLLTTTHSLQDSTSHYIQMYTSYMYISHRHDVPGQSTSHNASVVRLKVTTHDTSTQLLSTETWSRSAASIIPSRWGTVLCTVTQRQLSHRAADSCALCSLRRQSIIDLITLICTWYLHLHSVYHWHKHYLCIDCHPRQT